MILDRFRLDDKVAVMHLEVHRRERLQHAALDGVVDREAADVEGRHAALVVCARSYFASAFCT